MIINQSFRNRAVRYFIVAAGASLIVLGILMLASRWFDDLLLSLISFWNRKPYAPYWLDRLHAIGIEALLSGMVAVMIGWFALPRWNLMVSFAHKHKDLVTLAAPILAVTALWLPAVLIGHSATIAGERYWWLGDDAMISMRYGRNLAKGVGLVWNAGERVEGYSNFLWTIYMGLVHVFPIPDSKTSLVVLLTNIVLAIATIPVIISLVRALGGDVMVAAFTMAGFVLSRSVMAWTTAGFETTLLTFFFLLSTYRVIRESQLNQPSLLTFVLVATMSLVRADAAILSALLYALSVLLNNNRKLVVVYSVISLALPIAHEMFRVSYYGDVLPNTAYLKTLNWNGRYVAGWGYVLDFAKHYPVVIGVAAIGSLLSQQRSRLVLLGIFLAYMAYVAYVGGDAFPNFRFFVPVLPLLLVLTFLGVQTLEPIRVTAYLRSIFKQQSVQRATRLALLIGGIAIVVLSLAADLIGAGAQWGFGMKQFFGIVLGFILLTGSLTFPRWHEILNRVLQETTSFRLAFGILCLVTTPLIVPDYSPSRADMGNVRIGLLLKQNTPPDCKVADFWAGSVFYFSDRYAIDLLGKSDRFIARLPVQSDGTKPGHNKFDFDYSLGTLKPDLVVANFALPVQQDQMLQSATGDWAFSGQLYFNPVFQEHCLSNPIGIETWRTIFVCDWSSQMDNMSNWRELSLGK